MSILANVLTEARDITNCLTLMESVTTPLMGLLVSYKEYLVDVGKQSDALHASSLKVFQALNKQSTKQLALLEKRPQKQHSLEKTVKRSVSPLPAMTPAQTSKNPVKNAHIKSSFQIPKEIRSQEKSKTFMCFTCFRRRNDPRYSVKNYSWQAESFYLSHMQLQHSLVPNFEVALLSVNGISFSHAYFHGQLVNLFANSPIYEHLQMLVSYRQDPASSKIYICSCIAQGNATYQCIEDYPIFINPSDFDHHLAQKHNGFCPEGSSHHIRKKGKEKAYIYVHRHLSTLHLNPRIEEYIAKLEEVVEDEIGNYSIGSFLVQGDPLCRLELISKMGLRWRDAFLPLPESRSLQPTLKELQDYSRRWRQPTDQVRIEDASEDQNRLLNLQISLLDPHLYLCGECSERMSSCEEYISHIYLQHTQINTLNSHRFLFLTS